MFEWITSLDQKTLIWIHETVSSRFLDYIMPKLSFIGNGGMVWLIAALLLLFTKRFRRNGIMLLTAVCVGFLIGNLTLKPIIARARPIWPYATHLLLASSPYGYSFPSGHALSSFTAATILTLTNKRFGWLAVPLACLIAISRVYLYVHFPSDVFAGAAIGAVNGGCVFAFGKRLARRKRKEK